MPAAWQIVDVNDGPTGYIGVTEDNAWARLEKATWCSREDWAKERHARPLFATPHPPALETATEAVIQAAARVGLAIGDRNGDEFNAALQDMGNAIVRLSALRRERQERDAR